MHWFQASYQGASILWGLGGCDPQILGWRVMGGHEILYPNYIL